MVKCKPQTINILWLDTFIVGLCNAYTMMRFILGTVPFLQRFFRFVAREPKLAICSFGVVFPQVLVFGWGAAAEQVLKELLGRPK